MSKDIEPKSGQTPKKESDQSSGKDRRFIGTWEEGPFGQVGWVTEDSEGNRHYEETWDTPKINEHNKPYQPESLASQFGYPDSDGEESPEHS